MADVYKIGVTIAATNAVSGVLAVIGRELTGLHVKVQDLDRGFGRVGAAMASGAAAFGGYATLRGMATLVEHGKDLVQQQDRMLEAGIKQKEVADATAAAWKLSADVMARGVTQNLELIQGLSNMLGEFGVNGDRKVAEAIRAAPFAAKYETILKSLGENSDNAGADFLRFLELRGALVDHKTGLMVGTADLEHEFKVGAAIAAATHGHGTTVTAADLKMYQLQARAAGATLDETGLLEIAPLLAMLKGGAGGQGSRTGTGSYQLTRQILGGSMNSASAAWLMHLGLIDPKHAHLVGRGATAHYKIDPGGVVGEELMMRRPLEWIWNVLGKAMEEHGINGPDAKTRAIISAGFTSTVSGLLAEALRNETLIRKDVANERVALGTDQYAVAAQSPDVRINAFTEAWHNLMTALGAPIVNDATGLMKQVTDAMNGLTAWAVAHPKLVEEIEGVTAGLAGLAVVVGAGGVLMLGLTALGGPVGVLVTVASAAFAAAQAIKTFESELEKLIPDWLIPPGMVRGPDGRIVSRGAASPEDGYHKGAGVMPETGGTTELRPWVHDLLHPHLTGPGGGGRGHGFVPPPNTPSGGTPAVDLTPQSINGIGRAVRDGSAAGARDAAAYPNGSSTPDGRHQLFGSSLNGAH